MLNARLTQQSSAAMYKMPEISSEHVLRLACMPQEGPPRIHNAVKSPAIEGAQSQAGSHLATPSQPFSAGERQPLIAS